MMPEGFVTQDIGNFPMDSLAVVGRASGLKSMGIAISYASWISRDNSNSPHVAQHSAAVLVLIAAAMTIAHDDLDHTVIALQIIKDAADETVMARALTGIRKVMPPASEARESALPDLLKSMSNQLDKLDAPGSPALAEMVMQIAVMRDEWFRMSAVRMALSAQPHLHLSAMWDSGNKQAVSEKTLSANSI